MGESRRSLDPRQYLDPRVLQQILRLEVKARLIVEGFISGLHRSPYHGYSVEFAEHREYVPGDDIRHVDWKVYGRSDRFYIKQYEEETNLTASILLDASESMMYGGDAGSARRSRTKAAGGSGGPPPLTKYVYGTYITAAIAYLLMRQQDAVGLAVFDEEVRSFLSPAMSQAHFMNILRELDRQETARKTDLGTILSGFADRVKRKGLILIISDMFDDLDRIERGLMHLRHKRHEVVLFHLLDHDELTFPFQRMTLFEGLESQPDLLINPRSLRAAYLAEMESFQERLKKICSANFIDYVRIDTSQHLDVALTAYLAARAGRMRRR